jgi:hypothetical protein
VATQTINRLIDDLDGSDADATVEFGLDGKTYLIDLSAAHAEELRGALDKFVQVARSGARTAKTAGGEGGNRRARRATLSGPVGDTTAIRRWAHENNWVGKNGNPVSERGRISRELVADYLAAREAS